MNFLKQCLTTAILLLSLSTIAQRSHSMQKRNADSSWKKLVSVTVDTINYGKDFASNQARFLKFREEGLKFWKMFPDDSRRYTWLYWTVGIGGHNSYLKIEPGGKSCKAILSEQGTLFDTKSYSWQLNKSKLKEWEDVYPLFRKDFLAYVKTHEIDFVSKSRSGYELTLLSKELNEFLSMSLNKVYRKGDKIDVIKLRDLFLSSGKYLLKEDFNVPTYAQGEVFSMMDYFISIYPEYGLNVADMTAFFNSIKSSSVPILRNWAIQRNNLFALMKDPLSFKHESIDGDLIDLEKMRGKVVLIDFWATTCSSCIARMPAIKDVYDKYKSQGFKVISACMNRGDETDRIRAIEKKIGAEWPILLIGGKTKIDSYNSLGNQIWKKYGFWSVPQLLLLNKQGKLVMLNDKLRNGDFEPIVKKLLEEKYNSNQK